MKKIGPFTIAFTEEQKQQFYKYCDQIFDEAYLTNHSLVHLFEERFASFSGASSSILVNSGTAALELALKALDVKGKKVILPTNTFIATAIAIINAGAIPLPLDIENDYFGLCPHELDKYIRQDIGAVIAVHIGGHISPAIKKIASLCLQNNVPLIEDCAHAHGAELEGIKAGLFGKAGCFSHFLTKIMTLGEAGSVISNDRAFVDHLISLRQFGVDANDSLLHHNPGGSNFKVTEFQAALGLVELERVHERIQRRRENASRYQKNLAQTKWKAIADSPNARGSYYKQIIIPPPTIGRAQIIDSLRKINVTLSGGAYYYPLHRQSILASYVSGMTYPVADKFAHEHICPPCHPEITTGDIDLICEKLLSL
jgi:dTDP-4-amino-4,6-dideoxygalactose transaminase